MSGNAVSDDADEVDRGPFHFIVICEQVFFSMLIVGLVACGLTPIVCRQFDWPGPTWSGPLAGQLVLWVAIFGASAATRDRKHICIDAVGHLLPARWRMFLRSATNFFAAVICAWLVVPAVQSVSGEDPLYPSDQIVLWGLSEQVLATVLPVGLALLALRLLLASVYDLKAGIRGESAGGKS